MATNEQKNLLHLRHIASPYCQHIWPEQTFASSHMKVKAIKNTLEMINQSFEV